MVKHCKMMVNIDESSFSRSTKWNYSWLMKGFPCPIANIKFKDSISLISTITTPGTTFTAITQGGVDSKLFLEYLKKLVEFIKKTTSFKNREIAVLLDNASIHKSKIVKEYFKETKLCVYYLPTYSPELVQIELFFAQIK
jgi:hypothetical protein